MHISISISRQSWFLRLFIAAWGVDPEKLNFCQMFWGTLFIWLGPIARISNRLAGYLIKPTMGLGSLLLAIILLGLPSIPEEIGWPTVLLLALSLVMMVVMFFMTDLDGNSKEKERQARWLQSLTALMEKILVAFLRPFQMQMAMAINPVKPVAREIKNVTDLCGTFYHVVKSRTCPQVNIV